MPLTIEEMLQIGDLKDVEVLAGERGLPSRVVKTVVVIDVPNAGQWIRGGNFCSLRDIFLQITSSPLLI